ncbi:MAG TPA: family 10 glycosylhydrolase [Vicinamibacterales bacterium]|nr:family 10 glycosylhydrolase [Vicinamibacterales bacterium]
MSSHGSPDRRLRTFRALALCALALPVVASGWIPLRAERPRDEVRALWVTRNTLVSAEAIAAMVRSASASGFNTLLVQVRGRGDAYFSSRHEPRAEVLAPQPASFDPLATTIALAREHGLRVHAWVNVNLVSSGTVLPHARTHIVYQKPEWLMVPRELAFEIARIDVRSPQYLGRLARWTRATPNMEGLYLSPIHDGAVDHLVAILEHLAANYPLDGIHLDYVRYPGPQFDYSRTTLQAFRRYMLPEMTQAQRTRFSGADMATLVGLTDVFPERWGDFRRSRLNTLVMRARTAIKRRNPNLLFSAAVYPDAADAARTRLQDWRTWIENGMIDVVCPMAYTPDASTFAEQIASVRRVASGQSVWAGIGAYRLSSSQTIENIRTARRLGVDGVVLFSYDSLTRLEGPDYLSVVGRAAFAP